MTVGVRPAEPVEPAAPPRRRKDVTRTGRRWLVVAGLTLAAAAGGIALWASLRDEPRSGTLSPAASGDLLARVNKLVEEMPRPESGAYRPPTAGQAATLAQAFRDIRAGRLLEAAGLAAPLDFTVGRFTDTATGRHLVVLAERQSSDGSWPHAWGLYVFSPRSRSRLIVEVAHPLDDIKSYIVGVDAFRLGDAAGLFVAGASRFAGPGDSADMAHAEGTVFQAIHRAALRREAIIFEPHGFETDEHVDYGDVVVSSGAFPPDRIATEVSRLLRRRGLTVCLYDGEHCSQLGGTTNVQGAATRAAGDHFLHIEMSPAVRDNARARHELAAAVARAAA